MITFTTRTGKYIVANYTHAATITHSEKLIVISSPYYHEVIIRMLENDIPYDAITGIIIDDLFENTQ